MSRPPSYILNPCIRKTPPEPRRAPCRYIRVSRPWWLHA